ncbi:MAG: IS630 family transposase [Verrucomicrobia bacterium]|nr:MAG: IS630 family transposase [Verrucomicrobiota bacterium]
MDCGPDGKAFRRLNAMHLLLLGAPYEVVLRNSRCSERTMRLWISRFNQLGIDGLIYRPRPGRPRLLDGDAVRSEILPVVDDPSLAGQLHWTAVKLTGWLRKEKGVELSYRTLVRYLHEHGYARRIPRPVPEPPDRDTWLRQREDCAQRLQSLLEDPGAVVFFGDEAGFEGDPRPRHKWVKRGSRPTQGYYGGHLRRNVVGAVEPVTGRLVSLIVDHCNTEVFQVFLDTMAQEIPPEDGRQVHLVLDNAGWHKSAALNWHHIKPFYLSPYSPDFNPIERLWQHLKGNPMAGYLTNDGEVLTNRLLQSLQGVLDDSKLVRSICSLPSLNR